MKIPETPPDDSSIDDKVNIELFTKNSIEEISVKFGFHKDFPLRQELEDNALDYLMYHNNRDRFLQKEEKKNLEKVTKRIESLLEALKTLGWDERAHLAQDLLSAPYPFDRPKHPRLDLDGLIDQLRAWKWASNNVLSNINQRKGKGGRPRNFPVQFFIKELHRIYRDGTGKKDHITNNPYREEQPYGGEFFDFVESIFTNLKITKSNTQLGSAIKISLKGISKTYQK